MGIQWDTTNNLMNMEYRFGLKMEDLNDLTPRAGKSDRTNDDSPILEDHIFHLKTDCRRNDDWI